MFNSADVAIIVKSELTAAVEFDAAAAKRNIQAIRPEMEVFKVSPKTGKGMTEYLESLETRRILSRAAGGVAK
jgi:hydrogenase nickel incorporation protein HypB